MYVCTLMALIWMAFWSLLWYGLPEMGCTPLASGRSWLGSGAMALSCCQPFPAAWPPLLAAGRGPGVHLHSLRCSDLSSPDLEVASSFGLSPSDRDDPFNVDSLRQCIASMLPPELALIRAAMVEHTCAENVCSHTDRANAVACRRHRVQMPAKPRWIKTFNTPLLPPNNSTIST